MSEFSELVKNFDKIRQYMRDFYVYGFKVRSDYTYKSSRTYDNERRRMESWLKDRVQWGYSAKGKRVFLSVDSAQIDQNPLYAVWKSKSFTKSDLMLHFYLLELMQGGDSFTAEQLNGLISHRYGAVFDTQTVRGKLKEYEREGIFLCQKEGKTLQYALSSTRFSALPHSTALLEAVKLFQEVAPFGFVGSTLLDNQNAHNNLFRFKHHFIVHTLEDGIVFSLLSAMRKQKSVLLENHSFRSQSSTLMTGVPLKILVSTRTGRRYVCLYNLHNHRFSSVRLDSITEVAEGTGVENYALLQQKLEKNLPMCWCVSFGGRQRITQLFLKLQIDEEKEDYVLERLQREGQAGEVLRIEPNVFLYSITLFDANEASSWIKTFTGRILALECTDPAVCTKFYRDMNRMAKMYLEE